MSIVGYDNAGEATELSPTIWGDCPNTLLNDKSLGKFVNFRGSLASPIGILASGVVRPVLGNGFNIDCDDDTVLARTVAGTALSVETDADDNDAFSMFTAPLGAITKNSGKKLWFETVLAVGDVDADMGVFAGLVELAGASRDVLANDVASNALIGESLIGFVQDNGDDDAFDAVYRKDGGTVTPILNDVTNSTALASDDRASLTDGTLVKLGIKFDGLEKIKLYVRGVHVATLTVDSTVDQVKEYCAIIAIKTGTTAAEQVHVKEAQAAFQNRS